MNYKERDDETRDDADLNSPQLRSSSYLTPIEKAMVNKGLESRRGFG